MAEIRFESYYGVAPLDGNYLMHSGVKGQKWYHRRYQHEDGSLTPLGRIHYGVGPARDKAITDKDRQIRQEKKRVAYSSKMQKKHNLIDVPTNRDAAIDNARDMYRRGASNDEIKKYLKLNRLPNDAVGDIVREGNKYRANQKAKTAIKELERKQAEKQEKAAAKREKFLETANTRQLQAKLKDLSLDELKRVKKTATENKEKVEILTDVLQERRTRAERIKDLKDQRKDIRLEFEKQQAIDSGDPIRIKKYAKTMTTDELRSAIERVNRVNDIQRLSTEREAANKARKEALYADIQEKVGGISGIINYYRKASKKGEDLKLSEIMKAYNKGKGDAGKVELKGAAKEEYEKSLKDRTAKEASDMYKNLTKNGASKDAAEKKVMDYFAKRLGDLKGENKDEKDIKEAIATSKKAAAIEAGKQAAREGKDIEQAARGVYESKGKKSDEKESKGESEKTISQRLSDLAKNLAPERDPEDDIPLIKQNIKVSDLKDLDERGAKFSGFRTASPSQENGIDEGNYIGSPSANARNAKWNQIVTPKNKTPKASFLYSDDAKRAKKVSDLRQRNRESFAKSLKASGLTNAEIAKRLGVSESAVSEYLKKK